MSDVRQILTAVCSPIPPLLAGRALAAVSTILHIQNQDPLPGLYLLAVPGTPLTPPPTLLPGLCMAELTRPDPGLEVKGRGAESWVDGGGHTGDETKED